jgi:hypothetical protein
MAERVKGVREQRSFTMDFTSKLSDGASVTSYQGFASRDEEFTTTLTAQLNAEDTSATLDDDPGVGATIIVDPDDEDLEETFKVEAVTPDSGNFICDINPSAERQHSSAATVQYFPGESSRFLVDATPTPSGSSGEIAPVSVKEGVSGKTYTVHMQAVCDNGEVRESELKIDVVEFTPTTTITKQPGEDVDVAVSFAAETTKYSTTLSSAVAFMSRARTSATTVNGTNNAGATTLNLNANPGVGALVTVNVGQSTEEKLLVSAVSGSAPWQCTVSPLQFTHANAENVDYFPGVSARLLVSTNATIVGSEAIFRLRRAAAGQSYRFVVIATLGDGQLYQKSITLNVSELEGA